MIEHGAPKSGDNIFNFLNARKFSPVTAFSKLSTVYPFILFVSIFWGHDVEEYGFRSLQRDFQNISYNVCKDKLLEGRIMHI